MHIPGKFQYTCVFTNIMLNLMHVQVVYTYCCFNVFKELKKLQDEHALNYSTLKTKIISTE
jgi:hypothetical protein